MLDKNRVYDPKGLGISTGCDEDMFEDFTEEILDKFHLVGWDSRKPEVRINKCKTCGGTDFQIGTSTYYTAIKCKTCEYEICIHEG